MTESFNEYIKRRLTAILVCPRCDITYTFDDGRCILCGMDHEAHGPPRPLKPQGITPRMMT